jgi:hypothetical protein
MRQRAKPARGILLIFLTCCHLVCIPDNGQVSGVIARKMQANSLP